MIGIYKITNLINNKMYIGQSVHIEQRWKDHKVRAYYEDCEEYERPLYRAMRKYGLDNFSFEIIEECEIQALNEREQYWIQFYDTFKNGYNLTFGGDSSVQRDNILLSVIDEIYNELMNGTLTQSEIANKYGVSQPTICYINTGLCWYNKEYTYPLQSNRTKIHNTCIDCGQPISKNAIRCAKCFTQHKHNLSERPSREELKNLIRNNSFVSLGQKFNVSDNAIRKWCVGYNLPSKKTIINSYSDDEWEQI